MPKGIKHKDVGNELSYAEFHAEDAHDFAQGTEFPQNPSEGELFYRLDLHQWYQFDGSTWQLIGRGDDVRQLNASTGSILITAGDNITLSQDSGTITIIGAAAAGGIGLAAGSQTVNSGTVTFSDAHDIHFGMANSVVTASYDQSYQPAVSAMNDSQGSIYIEGGALISLNEDASSIEIINKLSSATTISRVDSANAIGAMASRFALEGHQHAGLWQISVGGNTQGQSSSGPGSVFLAGGNNITLSMATAAGGETVSIIGNSGGAGGDGYNILAAGSQTANTTGSVLFQNSNSITFGMSDSSVVTASFSQTVQPAVGSLNASSGTMSISAGNLMSVSNNANTITLINLLSSSATALDVTTATNAGTLSSRFALADHAHRGVRGYVASGIASTFFGNQVLSAGSLIALSTGGNTTAGSIAIHNLLSSSNIAQPVSAASNAGTLSSRYALADHAHSGLTTAAQSDHSHGAVSGYNLTATSASNGLTLSVAAPGAAAENNWVNISGNVAGNTTASGTTINWVGGNNITLSGLNNSQMRIDAGGGGGGATNRYYHEIIPGERLTTIMRLTETQISNRPLLSPFWLEAGGLSANTVDLLLSANASSNTVSLVATVNLGIYSSNNTTQITLVSSVSFGLSLVNSSQWSGIQVLRVTGLGGFSMSEGRWIMGLEVYATGTAHMNLRIYGADPFPAIVRWMGAGGSSGVTSGSLIFPFWGVYSATTTKLPDYINLNEVAGGRSAELVDYYAIIKEV